MNRLRLLLIASGLALLALVLFQPANAALTSLQAQIGITLIVNVSPSPIAYAPHAVPAGLGSPGIVARETVLRETPAMQREFDAQALHFDENGQQIVAQVQKPLLVQAEVTPNPNATLLLSSTPEIQIGATVGSTVQIPCAFTVQVSSTKSWTLYHGLGTDFSSTFPGKDVGNDSYVQSATPKPTSTPFVVYADDSSTWAVLGTGNTITTYCVTLTITVPAAVTPGTYSSNAIYTLYF